jgi:hypothetical protein
MAARMVGQKASLLSKSCPRVTVSESTWELKGAPAGFMEWRPQPSRGPAAQCGQAACRLYSDPPRDAITLQPPRVHRWFGRRRQPLGTEPDASGSTRGRGHGSPSTCWWADPPPALSQGGGPSAEARPHLSTEPGLHGRARKLNERHHVPSLPGASRLARRQPWRVSRRRSMARHPTGSLSSAR